VINVEACDRNVGSGGGGGVKGGGGGLKVTLLKSFILELTGNEPRPAFRTVRTLVIRTFEESSFEEEEDPHLYNVLSTANTRRTSNKMQ
jgi:hypothetical protein